MANTTIRKPYHCWNDCIPQGCPGHTAIVEYQSVSNALTLDNGRGQKFYMQTPELEAFQYMLRALANSRFEIEKIMTSKEEADF